MQTMGIISKNITQVTHREKPSLLMQKLKFLFLTVSDGKKSQKFNFVACSSIETKLAEM